MTAILYVFALGALLISAMKSREKTMLALKKAWKAFENILPQLSSIVWLL